MHGQFRTLFFPLTLAFCVDGSGQVINLNRRSSIHGDAMSMREGQHLVVKYKGQNTVNTAWIRNIDTDSTLADTVCLAEERLRLVIDRMPRGMYEVGYSGCWSGHTLLLNVRPKEH